MASHARELGVGAFTVPSELQPLPRGQLKLLVVAVALEAGCSRVLRINSAAELPDDLTGTVGVTAGASAPESLVEEVVSRLAPVHGVDAVRVTTEDEYFPPPRNIRDLQPAIEAASTALLGGSTLNHPKMDDRSLPASHVLAEL